VPAGQHGYHVSADLVRDVAVGGHPVGPDDHGIHFTKAHQEARHVVGDQRDRNLFLHHFPGGESRTLKERAGFIGDHLNALAGLNSRADHAQRGAVTACGQRSGIAVRQHAGAVGQQGCAVGAHRPVDPDILGKDFMGQRQQGIGQFRR
jgi:hypothetical protein